MSRTYRNQFRSLDSQKGVKRIDKNGNVKISDGQNYMTSFVSNAIVTDGDKNRYIYPERINYSPTKKQFKRFAVKKLRKTAKQNLEISNQENQENQFEE